MIDIPKNELLDKLAAGWKLRRKNWDTGDFIERNGGSSSCHWGELLKGDWEGEPAEPVCNEHELSFESAIVKMPKNAFIRRKAWTQAASISSTDILAKDWEVWG